MKLDLSLLVSCLKFLETGDITKETSRGLISTDNIVLRYELRKLIILISERCNLRIMLSENYSAYIILN